MPCSTQCVNLELFDKIYRVSQGKRFFVAPSYMDWILSNTDNLWLILFPDMGDFVPNRNFDQKSIQNPAKWLSSQMSKLWISAIFDQNSQKNIFFFTNLGWNLCFMKTILCSMDSSDSEVSKNLLDVVFLTSGTDLIRILRIVLW